MFSEYLHQETESRNALNAWPTFTTKIYLVKYILIYMSWILCLKLNSKSFLLQENVEILSSMFAVNAVRQKSRYFYMTLFFMLIRGEELIISVAPSLFAVLLDWYY